MVVPVANSLSVINMCPTYTGNFEKELQLLQGITACYSSITVTPLWSYQCRANITLKELQVATTIFNSEIKFMSKSNM